jgi:hypothetical protein
MKYMQQDPILGTDSSLCDKVFPTFYGNRRFITVTLDSKPDDVFISK